MHPIIIMWWWRRMKGQQRRRPYCCKQQFNARRTTTRWRHYTAVLSSSVSIRVSSSTLSHFPMFSTIPPKWFVARGRAIDLLDSSKVVPISNAKNRRDSYLPKKHLCGTDDEQQNPSAILLPRLLLLSLLIPLPIPTFVTLLLRVVKLRVLILQTKIFLHRAYHTATEKDDNNNNNGDNKTRSFSCNILIKLSPPNTKKSTTGI